MRSGAGPYNLGGLIAGSLKTLDLERRIKEQTCLLVWDEVVGEQVAAAAQPEFVRDGRLFAVVAKSPVWANELGFYKSEMIEQLNRRVGGRVLKDIVFRVGRPARARSQDSGPEPVETPGPEGIPLTDAELQEIEAVASQAAPELADHVRHVLESAARVEKWKRSRGWTPCKRCGVLQDSPCGECPPCRMRGK